MASPDAANRPGHRDPGRASDHGAAGGGTESGRPLVDRLKGSQLHNLKELRPGSRHSSEVRILFIFDPDRRAVLLVAGDKAGQWSSWYREAIPLAEARYATYLKEQQR